MYLLFFQKIEYIVIAIFITIEIILNNLLGTITHIVVIIILSTNIVKVINDVANIIGEINVRNTIMFVAIDDWL